MCVFTVFDNRGARSRPWRSNVRLRSASPPRDTAIHPGAGNRRRAPPTASTDNVPSPPVPRVHTRLRFLVSARVGASPRASYWTSPARRPCLSVGACPAALGEGLPVDSRLGVSGPRVAPRCSPQGGPGRHRLLDRFDGQALQWGPVPMQPVHYDDALDGSSSPPIAHRAAEGACWPPACASLRPTPEPQHVGRLVDTSFVVCRVSAVPRPWDLARVPPWKLLDGRVVER